MTKEQMLNIAADATNQSELKSSDIPAIDLYVDQILNLVSGKLAEGSERYSSRQLTKTMINNYSKDGVITPVKGKKYNREQVAQILYVYSLKNTLSIGEIKRLLQGAYGIDGFDASDLISLYDSYQEIRDLNGKRAINILESDILEGLQLDPENEKDYVATICALVSLSAQLKNIAQALIDERYPEVTNEDEKKEKKEKAEQKAEQKAKPKAEKKKKKDAEGESIE